MIALMSPINILLPTKTEENTAGNLPTLDITNILLLLIGSKLAMYVINLWEVLAENIIQIM